MVVGTSQVSPEPWANSTVKSTPSFVLVFLVVAVRDQAEQRTAADCRGRAQQREIDGISTGERQDAAPAARSLTVRGWFALFVLVGRNRGRRRGGWCGARCRRRRRRPRRRGGVCRRRRRRRRGRRGFRSDRTVGLRSDL